MSGERDPLAARDVVLLRAPNPGPLTLGGTNSYLVGRDPTWCIDPGPALPVHLDALLAEIERRGGLAGIAVTHWHGDHVEAISPLRERTGGPPVAAASGPVDVRVADGERLGPLRAIHTPGHTTDHMAFLAGDACFTGDAVLGEGSVFITPDPGALAGYLAALRRLVRERVALLCPGHGPVVADAEAKLREYIDHRLDRERRLLAALAQGRRTVDELLDGAWPEVPEPLRPAASMTLAAHLDKLEEEGLLPAGVQRPPLPPAPARAAGVPPCA
jgi:glyoxylase-like metal-dependent hydrolase (beta-lactamase superfamily II)